MSLTKILASGAKELVNIHDRDCKAVCNVRKTEKKPASIVSLECIKAQTTKRKTRRETHEEEGERGKGAIRCCDVLLDLADALQNCFVRNTRASRLSASAVNSRWWPGVSSGGPVGIKREEG